MLDFANGLAPDKSVRTAHLAVRLAEEAGLPEAERRAAWFAAILRHIGCTAFAATEATFAADDVRLRSALLHGDSNRLSTVLGAVVRANPDLGSRAVGLFRLAGSASALRSDWVREACEAARLLSEQLGLGPTVGRALDQVFERFDGEGGPAGLGGADLCAAGHAATVAHVAVLYWLDGGIDGAAEVLRARSGTMLDPAWVTRALALLPELDRASTGAPTPSVAEADPPIDLEALVAAFGAFADLQTPIRNGHARAVAGLVDRAAAALGIAEPDRRDLRWAGHLHDLGEVAVPTAIWNHRRALGPAEWERVRLHPYLTERVLAGAAPLTGASAVAGAHHERPDGKGYHRGTAAHGLSRSARLLAAADAWAALVAPRPHRPALGERAAVELLRAGARDGQWDAECVEIVLVAAGQRRDVAPSASPLTQRETEVLRELASGKTNKEIAAALAISARTVQNHTHSIYAKLAVSTRAGATLVAARSGLLD